MDDKENEADKRFSTISAKSEIVSANIRKFNQEMKTEARRSVLENIAEGNVDSERKVVEKPMLTPKPNIYLKKVSKSSENLADDFKTAKRLVEKKFGTEAKRNRNRIQVGNNLGFSLPKKNYSQLDVDRENVSILNSSMFLNIVTIYEVVNPMNVKKSYTGCRYLDQKCHVSTQ